MSAVAATSMTRTSAGADSTSKSRYGVPAREAISEIGAHRRFRIAVRFGARGGRG